MTPTIKAILARCGWDTQRATDYCNEIALCNKLSLEIRLEYANLAKHFLKGMSAHV
jgi:hypothetical protein